MEVSSDQTPAANSGISPEFDIGVVVKPEILQTTIKEIDGLTVGQIAELLATARAKADKYKEWAVQDPLTGLLNRRGLDLDFTRVSELINRNAQESGEKFTNYTLIMLDLVGMKRVNDTLGQPAGDKFLTGTAKAITETIRGGTDIAARTGGDEFMIVLPNTQVNAAVGIIGRIQEKMPQDRQFNVVIAGFNSKSDLSTAIEVVGESLKNAKEIAPKDETGRSLGFGMVVKNE